MKTLQSIKKLPLDEQIQYYLDTKEKYSKNHIQYLYDIHQSIPIKYMIDIIYAQYRFHNVECFRMFINTPIFIRILHQYPRFIIREFKILISRMNVFKYILENLYDIDDMQSSYLLLSIDEPSLKYGMIKAKDISNLSECFSIAYKRSLKHEVDFSVNSLRSLNVYTKTLFDVNVIKNNSHELFLFLHKNTSIFDWDEQVKVLYHIQDIMLRKNFDMKHYEYDFTLLNQKQIELLQNVISYRGFTDNPL